MSYEIDQVCFVSSCRATAHQEFVLAKGTELRSRFMFWVYCSFFGYWLCGLMVS